MEQRDYILREIEKIGQMLRMIFEKIKRRDPREEELKGLEDSEVSEMLREQLGFELEKAMSMNEEAFGIYLSGLQGFSVPNMELLADVMAGLAKESHLPASKEYLLGALRLYEFCNLSDRTYSLDREQKIEEIRSFLSGDFKRSAH